MNRFVVVFVMFGFGLLSTFLNSCDKVSNPIKPALVLDTSIYPFNWADYEFPEFGQNTNIYRNVLLEDYTGHRCPNCPAAAVFAANIENANPTRVFVASIHAGSGGMTAFQELASDCGQASNPTNKYCTIFYNNESLAYGETFASGFGFFGNPQGTINRLYFSGAMFLFKEDWEPSTNTVLSENNLKINIQSQANYYAQTNGFYLHTEIEFLEELTGDYSTVVYLIEKDVVDYQDSMSTALPYYHHHNVFRGCIDGLAWGRSIIGDQNAGAKHRFDYSYKLPANKSNTDFHLLVYVYNVDTYEIIQVIKQELN